MIEAISIVIPARNESALIARCLTSVSRAIGELRGVSNLGAPSVRVVVVLDSCTDETARIVSTFDFVDVIEIDAESVGVARSVGVASALTRGGGAAGFAWVANTDADSIVPPHWLIEQVRLANSGADVIVGTVSPVMSDLTGELAAGWQRVRGSRNPGGHVHGANLSFRGSSYLTVGGFTPDQLHEDVGLVARFRAASAAVCDSLDIDVETSGRKANRVPGGYASYLHDGALLSMAHFEGLTG